MNESYNPKNPGPYITPLYERAKEWYNSIAPALQEQWDMWMNKDAYQDQREQLGYAHLSFPQIFIAIDAIQAVVDKILQSEQNLQVFDAINSRDIGAKIAGERLTSAFGNIRADLGYDDKIRDMVLGSTIFDYCHMKLEPEWIEVQPGLSRWMQESDYGGQALYPSFNIFHPGRVISDGSYEKDADVPAKFEESFVTYQQLKRDWPKQVGPWLLKHERGIDDVEFSARAAMNSLSDQSIYTFYAKQLGAKGSEQSQRRGYLLVQAEVQAINAKGDVEHRTVWFLPHVVPDNDTSGIHQHGYILGEQGPSFNSVKTLYRTCRSRRVPFSSMGRGTAGLLIPFQRQFSAQVAMQMDQDQMYQTPPVIMREGAWVGRENPAMLPSEIWTVTDGGLGLSLDQIVRPMPLSNPNRAHLAYMNEQLSNMGDLISAATEATTGAQTSDRNKTLGAFEMRNQGGLSRINTQFVEHALSLIWLGNQTLNMMKETPEAFMTPPHAVYSETLGHEDALHPEDLSAAVRLRVPSLSEFNKRELGKVMWMMVADSFAKVPLYAESPELQLWVIEHQIRAMGVPEMDVQEAVAAAQQGVIQAQMNAAMTALPPSINTQPTPGLQPGKMMTGGMRSQLAS